MSQQALLIIFVETTYILSFSLLATEKYVSTCILGGTSDVYVCIALFTLLLKVSLFYYRFVFPTLGKTRPRFHY